MSGFSLAANEILKKQKTPITRIRVLLKRPFQVQPTNVHADRLFFIG